MSPEPIAIAVLAKAPVPERVKTRLIPALGPDGAAMLQQRLISRTLATAVAAKIGPVTLWGAPESDHPDFRALAERFPIALDDQPSGDLGARMLAAIAAAAGPVLVIGSDCPALRPDHLRIAAGVLNDGIDVVVTPADDGGYVLIGMRRPQPVLFKGMPWSTAGVMAETRGRLARHGLSWREPARLWDLDVPDDVNRARREGFAALFEGLPVPLNGR